MFNNTINKIMSLNYYWTIIPQIIKAIERLIDTIVTNEFIIAQAPQQMKGFLFGFWGAFNGIAKLIGYNINYLFNLLPQSIPIICGF